MAEFRTVGVILEDASDEGLKHTFFSEILESFKCVLEKHGISLLFLNKDRSGDNKITYLEQMKKIGCSGCIIACIEDESEVDEILNSGLPVVAIDKDYKNAICVSSDNQSGIMLLTEYVIEMGHKKIAFIMGDNNKIANIRLNGFLCACEKHHIKIPDEYILAGKFRNMDKAQYHTENLLKLEEPPTCIMYSDDYACIGGINLINARGLVLAKDIAITGYDGNDIVSQFEPKLTTVKQDGTKMGEVAAEKLLEEIDDPSVDNNGHYLVEVILEKGRTVHKVY